MKYVVAVSGGVDSVVLLDMLVRSDEHELIVAHFDHGIRGESDADARFVEALAAMYRLPFYSKRVALGKASSEEAARRHRYDFLKHVADRHGAKLVTAHHCDDMVETVAINLTRGTGWRGLNVMSDASIVRPLLEWTKLAIYDYAVQRNLEWVEDETNSSGDYLRNRIRARTMGLDDEMKRQIMSLRDDQARLATAIDQETDRLLTTSRYFMAMIDETSGIELLRATLASYGLSLTRPQRARLLHAIKTVRPGARLHAGENVTVEFTAREFIVKHPL